MDVDCVSDPQTVKYIQNIYANKKIQIQPYSAYDNFNSPNQMMNYQQTQRNATSLHQNQRTNFQIPESEIEEPTRNYGKPQKKDQAHLNNHDSGNIEPTHNNNTEKDRESKQIMPRNLKKKPGSICFSIVKVIPIEQKGSSVVMFLPIDTRFQNAIEIEQESLNSSIVFSYDSEISNMNRSEVDPQVSGNQQIKTQNQNSFIKESKNNNNQTSRQENELIRREHRILKQKPTNSHVQFGDFDHNFMTSANHRQNSKSKSNIILHEHRQIKESRIGLASSKSQISPIYKPISFQDCILIKALLTLKFSIV